MKRVYNILLGVMAMVLAVACGKERNEDATIWGYTEYYEDFMFWDYEPTLMEKTLEVELSPDACKMFAKEGCSVQFYVSSSKSEYVAPKGVDVYYNDVECKDHHFLVDMCNVSGDGATKFIECKLGLQFNDSAAEGEHVLYFGYDPKSIKCLREVSIDGNIPHKVNIKKDLTMELGSLATNGVVVEKKDIMNPVKEKFMWAGIIFVVLLLLWYLMIRPMRFKHLRFSKIYVAYPGAYDEKRVDTNGCRRLILTNKPIKQNIFKRILLIADAVEVNEVWTSRVTITCKDKHYYRILGAVSYTPLEPMRGEEFTIITDEGAKVKLNS